MTLLSKAIRWSAGLAVLGAGVAYVAPALVPAPTPSGPVLIGMPPVMPVKPADQDAPRTVAAIPPAREAAAPPPPAVQPPRQRNGLAAIGEAAHPDAAAPPAPRPSPSGDVVAYAPDAIVAPPGNAILRSPPPVNADVDGLREAVAAYRAGDLAKGDAEAARIDDPVARLTAEWVAIYLHPRDAGMARLSAFLRNQPDWPGDAGLESRIETILYSDRNRPALAKAWFETHEARTVAGKVALARAFIAGGDAARAKKIIVDVWRNEDMTTWLEGQMTKEFGDYLTDDDHRARAARLAYAGKSAGAIRAATLVGKDMVALVRARLAVNRDASSDKLMKAVPAALQKDPLYLLSRIQILRRADKLTEAAQAMKDAPRDPAVLIDLDEWWTERRVLARKLLDEKRNELAYEVAAGHVEADGETEIEAQFHAGWIAFRFLNDPIRATTHFAKAARVAQTPISRARTAYWQGRAAEARGVKAVAQSFYEFAAQHPIAYYGQLASARLGEAPAELRRPASVATGVARLPAIRVVEMLLALDEKDLARTLAFQTGRTLDNESQLAALADVLARDGDARATLVVGKLATQRGHILDESAFPTFGIPSFERPDGAAALPVVYAIARQESAFAAKVVSHAGAKGLMQMIDSTARQTAKQLGVDFDKARLTEDPAFNAQLGAAHLGHLLAQYRGSYILTFVAYNAGPRRVKEWIAAYGDPRDPEVDPVDWVERIPFTETRNYVQRVIENLEIYKLRFGDTKAFAIEADLRGGKERL